MNVLISIILPCYNAMEYLEEALSSILTQTYNNIEIIAIDDGSTDDTLKYLNKEALKDERIKVVINERNLGLIKTLNKAISLAKGEYIARMDADDISHPMRIEKLFNFLNESQSDIVSCNFDYIDSKSNFVKSNTLKAITPPEIVFSSFLFTPICHAGLLGRKIAFTSNPYNESKNNIHTEDYELWARMIRNDVAFNNFNEILYSIRINTESVSHKFEAIQKENFTICSLKHYNLFFKENLDLATYKVVVNRFENINKKKLNDAFAIIDQLVSRYGVGNQRIKTIGELQKLDILIQVVKTDKKYVFTLLKLLILNIKNSSFRSYFKSKI